jgi:extracellular factor (EF) 3-hydroxypalmitic acid methyl ester biosynthesis protein
MKLNDENLLASVPVSAFSSIALREVQEERLLALSALIAAGGPKRGDYAAIDRFMDVLYHDFTDGQVSIEEVRQLQNLFSSEWLENTIQGYGFRKPMGYAGDFGIIDMIYTRYVNPDPAYRNWDNYFHYHAATCAVRNRKEFFKEQIFRKLNNKATPVRLLNVASGPARDLFEVYEAIGKGALKSTCVDLDHRAIAFAKNLCGDHLDHIQFINKNILRFSTNEKFDVIWSAGLFDYFDDRTFVMVLKRFLSWLKPGGEIILGNFSEYNPSRGYMELFGEWFLTHRSSARLIGLALEAGAEQHSIHVDKEPLGINLFLKIRSI